MYMKAPSIRLLVDDMAKLFDVGKKKICQAFSYSWYRTDTETVWDHIT